MGRIITEQPNLPEDELVFERERLLNLIDSKVKRKEMDIARGLAEELFKTEIGYALLRKMRMLRKHTDLLLKVIFALVSVLVVCTVAMILNIRPSFGLLGQGLAIMGIILAVTVDAFLVKRFERALKGFADAYETWKQSFVERVLTCGIKYRDPEDWQWYRS